MSTLYPRGSPNRYKVNQSTSPPMSRILRRNTTFVDPAPPYKYSSRMPYYSSYASPDYSFRDPYVHRSVIDSSRYSSPDMPSWSSFKEDEHSWINTRRPREYNHSSSESKNTTSSSYHRLKNNRFVAADLRRKMVFVLHDEIEMSPSVTILEEITDMNRITELCMSTLRSMMESKRYRKYLHHMNNNADTVDTSSSTLQTDLKQKTTKNCNIIKTNVK